MTETDQTASAAAPAAEPTHIDASLASPVPSGTMAAEVAANEASDPVSAQSAGLTDKPSNDLLFTDAEKAKIRANIRWLMTELDYARSGRRADERETLNP